MLECESAGSWNTDDGDILETIHERLLVGDTITHETTWTRTLEFGIKCGSIKKEHLRT